MGPVQDTVLDDELDVDNAAAPVFQIELLLIGRVVGGAHLGAHLADLTPQLVRVAPLAEDVAPDVIEAGAHGLRPQDHAGANQCLVLPGPRVFALIVVESFQCGHHRAGTAAGSETHVYLVENPGRRAGGQYVHHPLHQAQIVLGVVDLARAIYGFPARAGPVVQKYDIEVGVIAQFQPPQFSIRHHTQSSRFGSAFGTGSSQGSG